MREIEFASKIFPALSFADPNEVEAFLSSNLTPVKIDRFNDNANFGFDVSRVDLGDTQVVYNSYSTDTDINAGCVGDIVIAGFLPSSRSRVTIDRVALCQNKNSSAIMSPGRHIYIERKAGLGTLAISAPMAKVVERFELLAGRAIKGPLRMKKKLPLNGAVGLLGLQTAKAALLAHRQLYRSKKPTVLGASLDSMALDILASLPSNYSAMLDMQEKPMVVPKFVAVAEEYMDANLAEPVTIADLLVVCQCSRTTLFNSFKRFRGYSPYQFLIDRRLQRVRQQLLTVTKPSITNIAFEFGFVHPSRFNVAYRRRFGETPSKTVAKSVNLTNSAERSADVGY